MWFPPLLMSVIASIFACEYHIALYIDFSFDITTSYCPRLVRSTTTHICKTSRVQRLRTQPLALYAPYKHDIHPNGHQRHRDDLHNGLLHQERLPTVDKLGRRSLGLLTNRPVSHRPTSSLLSELLLRYLVDYTSI